MNTDCYAKAGQTQRYSTLQTVFESWHALKDATLEAVMEEGRQVQGGLRVFTFIKSYKGTLP